MGVHWAQPHAQRIKTKVNESVIVIKTKVQKYEAKKAFTEFDKNKDGRIDKNELRIMIKEMYGRWLSDRQLDSLMTSADANQNGTLDTKEFVEMFFRMMDPTDSCNVPRQLEWQESTETIANEAFFETVSTQMEVGMQDLQGGFEAVEQKLLKAIEEGEGLQAEQRVFAHISLARAYVFKRYFAKAQEQITKSANLVTVVGDKALIAVDQTYGSMYLMQGKIFQSEKKFSIVLEKLLAAPERDTVQLASTYRYLGDTQIVLAQRANKHDKKAQRAKTKEAKTKDAAGTGAKQTTVVCKVRDEKYEGDDRSVAELLKQAGDNFHSCVNILEEQANPTKEMSIVLALGYKGLALTYQHEVSLADQPESQLKYAEMEYKKAIAIQEKALVAGSIGLITSYVNLAGLYVFMNFKENKCAEAEEMYNKVLPLLEAREIKAGGKPMTSLTLVYRNLATLYTRAGKKDKAERYLGMVSERKKKEQVNKSARKIQHDMF